MKGGFIPKFKILGTDIFKLSLSQKQGFWNHHVVMKQNQVTI